MKNNTTVYVGMDVHEESFTLCSLLDVDKEPKNVQKVEPDHLVVLKYINGLRKRYGEDARFVCGYEAGCLGYSLYRDLASDNLECVILAPTTMAVEKGGKHIKTDSRDAKQIATCLRNHTYSAVHIPTKEDERVKEYIRMRDDMKADLKRHKQQLLAFCLRHHLVYSGTKSNWTQAHFKWLEDLKLPGLDQETKDGYLTEIKHLMEKIERYDKRIEEVSQHETYKESVDRMSCLIGITRPIALAVITEIGDFKRFAHAGEFMSYLGLVPGEHSSSTNVNRLGITKAGNVHVRRLLVEAAQCFTRGKVGNKSKALKLRQAGNPEKVIAYADKANDRLRRRYFSLMFGGKNGNVAKTAVARELAGFIWGMMNDRIE